METRNQLDSAIYQLEKTLRDSGDKLAEALKSKGDVALADAKKALESNDTDKMKASMEQLSKVGADLYAASQAAAGGDKTASAGDASAGAEPKKADRKSDVVDADFEVVDEDKK